MFCEPVASDVRLIQRKGRTGRDAPGRVVILTTDRTANEAYLHAGMRREKSMNRMVKRLAQEGIRGDARPATQESGIDSGAATHGKAEAIQQTIDDFGQRSG